MFMTKGGETQRGDLALKHQLWTDKPIQTKGVGLWKVMKAKKEETRYPVGNL